MQLTKNTTLREVFKLVHPCRCVKCENGCNYGSGFLIGDDLNKIAQFLGITEKEAKEKYFEEVEQFNAKLIRPKLGRKENRPYGKCVFFDEKTGCKIHEVKPLQCKIAMPCKDYGEDLMLWFMHKYMINPKDTESVRQYGIYLKSGGKTLK